MPRWDPPRGPSGEESDQSCDQRAATAHSRAVEEARGRQQRRVVSLCEFVDGMEQV